MELPFENNDVPADLKHMLAGGKLLQPQQEQVVDPRQLPFTYEEVRFRGCSHVWKLTTHPDPEQDVYIMFDLIIRDVARGKVYTYGLPLEGAEQLILELQELIKIRDEKNTPVGEDAGDQA